MKILTLPVEKVRELEKKTIEDFGFPSFLLMENSGRELARIATDVLFKYPKSAYVVILCGGGNNGGDGLVAARYLSKVHDRIRIYMFTEPSKLIGDANLNYQLAKKSGLEIHRFSEFKKHLDTDFQHTPLLIIDAILGSGFAGDLREPISTAVEQMNHLKIYHNAKVTVIAADMPTGLDGNRGPLHGPVMRADLTVTFGCLKPGLTLEASKPYVGRWEVADIGIPNKLLLSFSN